MVDGIDLGTFEARSAGCRRKRNGFVRCSRPEPGVGVNSEIDSVGESASFARAVSSAVAPCSLSEFVNPLPRGDSISLLPRPKNVLHPVLSASLFESCCIGESYRFERNAYFAE